MNDKPGIVIQLRLEYLKKGDKSIVKMDEEGADQEVGVCLSDGEYVPVPCSSKLSKCSHAKVLSFNISCNHCHKPVP